MTFFLCLMFLTTSASDAGGDVGDRVNSYVIKLYESGEYHAAVDHLSQQVRSLPENGSLLFWLGKSYLKLRKWDDAIRELEKAVQVEPSNALYHLWLGRAFGRKAEHSSFLSALGPARHVAKEFEMAVRLDPGNLEARFDLLEFDLNAPGMLGGGREKASEQVAEIARISPRASYLARARVHEKDEKWNLALKELTQATVDFPDSARAYQDLADLLFLRADFEGAATNARRSIALVPSQGGRLILAASQVRLAQDLPQAEQSLSELAAGPLGDLAPSFEEVYYWLGQAQLAQGKRSEARKSFERALSYNPEFALARMAPDQAL